MAVPAAAADRLGLRAGEVEAGRLAVISRFSDGIAATWRRRRSRGYAPARLPGLGGILVAMAGYGSCPVMVGRARQMGALQEALAAARQGGHPAVLIGGEAGVGKSRLLAEFTAATAGARVLTGGCLQLGADGLPFAPFTAMLRDLVRELGADAVTAMLPGRGAPELARLLSELGEPETGRDPGGARARLFEELLTLLEHLAEPWPVVLVVEDAHWADESTRNLLAFLIAQQRVLRGVLIAVTFRSDELHRTHLLRPLLAELARIEWVQRVELPRLTWRETGELAARLQGHEPSPDLAARLFERSEGNPLFIEELLNRPDLTRAVPESLRDLLLASVARLPEHTREVLQVASAGVDPNGYALLSAVSGLDDEELARALRPAVAGNVLLATREGYSFRHALIREAVYDDLLPGEGERLHARFAAALEADPSLVEPGRAAIEAAHHWYEARDATRALTSAWLAAAQARQSVAYGERLALLGRVLALWDQVQDAAQRIGTDHPGVLEEAMRTAIPAADDQRGLAFANALLKEIDSEAEPARVALVLCKRSQFKQSLGHSGYTDDLHAALALVPSEVSASVRAEVLLSLAQFGYSAEQRAFAEQALELARKAGDTVTEVNALLTIAIGTASPGYQAASGSAELGIIAEARALAVRVGDWPALTRAAIQESHLLEGAGEHECAAEVARQGMRDAETNGLTRGPATFLAGNLAESLSALGRWDEALEVVERALELSPPPLNRSALRMRQVSVAVARGNIEAATEALSDARRALSDAHYQDQYHLPLAQLEAEVRLAADAPAAALAEAAGVVDRYDLSRATPLYAWPLLVMLAHTGLAALRGAKGGQEEALRDRATALLERLRIIAEKLAAFGPMQRAYQLTFAAQSQTASLLRAGTAPDVSSSAPPTSPTPARAGWDPASPTAARVTWDETAAAWEGLGQPHSTAIALLRAAEAALADGDREAAGERLRRAAPLGDRLGARPLGDEIASLARRARIPLTDGTAEPDPGRLGLTDREFEVLRLVAAGRSNREIAAELFISAKTASVHVSNILAKLGVGSRGEAAARAYGSRLFDARQPS
jgi:DNA-binding CsgD family transcriptional regulator/tetratricopeptide (TPR) repeat protein